MKALLLYLAIFVIVAGCRDQNEPYSIDRSFWPPVEDEADSLVAILNAKAAHTIYEPGDTLLANRIDSIGRVKQLPQLRARALYWKAVVNSKYGFDSTLIPILKQAVLLCDSASYPYDYVRMTITGPSIPVLTMEDATRYLKAIEMLKQWGDSLYYASTKAKFAYYIDKYNHKKALEMELSVSQTLHRIKAYEQLVSVDYNIAVSWYETFHYERAFAMIDSLRKNPNLYKHSKLVQLVDMIYYEKDRNPAYLYDALRLCDSLRNPASMSAYIQSALAVHYMERNMPDSMRYFKNQITEEAINMPRTKHLTCYNLIKIYEYEGNADSAALYQTYIDMYEKEQTSFMLGSRTESELISNTLLNLECDRAKLESAKQKTVVMVASASVVLLCISGLVIWALLRWKRRQRSRLVAEQRRAAISEVRAAEKERVLAEIVESMRQEGDELNPHILRINAKLTPDSDWQKVKLLFDEINPEFVDRLRRNYPALTPSEVRLASLVYLGLDTKHIARLLSIAPDSVKKTRQRLRAKLAISPDTDLHDFLSAIMR